MTRTQRKNLYQIKNIKLISGIIFYFYTIKTKYIFLLKDLPILTQIKVLYYKILIK